MSHSAISALLGFGWYLALYGRFPLYVSHVNWIYAAGGDVLQHQLGWEWFRHEPWRFPLGSITAYGYPLGTSVTFMDAIPLLAIPLKLFSPWLEPTFQYFGLWELASLCGQMLAGMLILHEFTRSTPLKILGASMLVLSPPMIFRAFYHSSLSAHWILLAAIWLILLEYRRGAWRAAWLALFAVAVWVHVYFIPMLLPLWMVAMYFRYQHHKNWRWLIFDALAVLAVVFAAGYSIGLFGLNLNSLSAVGFGVFSWNLNGFFNPFLFSSAYLKDMVTGTSGQYEGFSYLGLGNLLILPAAVYLFFQKDTLQRNRNFLLPLGAAAGVFTLFALSNRAYLNAQLLWDIPVSDTALNFLNLFRTSGRFIWPVFYLLVLFGLYVIIRNVRYAIPVLLVAVALQFSDLQPLYGAKKLPGPVGYESNLQSEFWELAAAHNQHIVIIPARKLPLAYEPIALYAVEHRLTLNMGYFARSDTQAMLDYGEQAWAELQARNGDARTIYILIEPERAEFAKANLADELLICEIDTYTVLLSAKNEALHTGFDFAPYCTLQVR